MARVAKSKAAKFNSLTSKKLQKAINNDPEVDLAKLLPLRYSTRLQSMRDDIGSKSQPQEHPAKKIVLVIAVQDKFIFQLVKHFKHIILTVPLNYLVIHDNRICGSFDVLDTVFAKNSNECFANVASRTLGRAFTMLRLKLGCCPMTSKITFSLSLSTYRAQC
ncbi:hypothetical protein ACMYSQ_012402 [Aspergillus niger]